MVTAPSTLEKPELTILTTEELEIVEHNPDLFHSVCFTCHPWLPTWSGGVPSLVGAMVTTACGRSMQVKKAKLGINCSECLQQFELWECYRGHTWEKIPPIDQAGGVSE